MTKANFGQPNRQIQEKKTISWRAPLAFVSILATIVFLFWLAANFSLYYYPKFQLTRAVSKTDFVLVRIVDTDTTSLQLPFKLTGVDAREFLSQVVSQSSVDPSRYTFTEMLQIELFDKDEKLLFGFTFRPNVETSLGHWETRYSKYVNLIKETGIPLDFDFGVINSNSLQVQLSPTCDQE